MTLCLCPTCSQSTPGPTWTEAHRHACEVRAVAALPSNEARAEYLDRVRRSRGADEAQALRREVWNAMNGGSGNVWG